MKKNYNYYNNLQMLFAVIMLTSPAWISLLVYYFSR